MGASIEAGLLLSHPGHELRVYTWIERVRPLVWIVTDGSGRDAESRAATSERELARLGAPRAKLFGRLRDLDLYAAVRRGSVALFLELADEVAEDLVSREVPLLVSDSPEQLILAHDLIAGVADAAVTLAARRGWAVAHFDFAIHAHPDTCPPHARHRARAITLAGEELERKRAVSERYAEIAPEIAADRALHGDGAFARELLRPVDVPFERLRPTAGPPEWQRHGERLAREGVYPEAIRWDRHVAPILGALRAHAGG